jgi:hypothetical protein
MRMAEEMAMVGLGHRLGDMIDDYCPRCKLLLNHAIASMVEGKVAKVICQTCLTEHAFLHGKGAKKLSNPRATLFDQVLAGVSSSDDEKPSKAGKKKSAAAPRRARDKNKPSKHGRSSR